MTIRLWQKMAEMKSIQPDIKLSALIFPLMQIALILLFNV